MKEVLDKVKEEHKDVNIFLEGNAIIKADQAFYSVSDRALCR